MYLKEVKPLKQKLRMCGPASLKIVLKYYGNNQTQEDLKKQLNSTILMGTTNVKMVEVAQSLGFKAQFKFNSSINEIKKLISNKIPPIIGWITPEGGSHYSVINGINEKYIYIVDPSLNKVRKMNIEDFSKRWLDVDWENLSTTKKFIVSSKVLINNIINKKTNYELPLKSNEIIHREIIIIEPMFLTKTEKQRSELDSTITNLRKIIKSEEIPKNRSPNRSKPQGIKSKL